MRHVSQTLELALATLTEHPTNSRYMCCHLDSLCITGRITEAESAEAQRVIRVAINNCVTLAQHLRDSKQMPKHISAWDDEYRDYQTEFYRKLIATLRAGDVMFLIIESAYHCAYSLAEIHRNIKMAGLPETSDETIANLLGKYADSIKE